MRNTFLDYLNNRRVILTESFNAKKIDKALKIIDSVLCKHIDGLVPVNGFAKMKQGDTEYYSKQYIVKPIGRQKKYTMFQINFTEDKKVVDVYSIDFFDNTDILWTGKGKSKLTLYTLGSSIIYFLPIIWNVVNSKNYTLSEKDAIKIGKKDLKKIKESYDYKVGTITYKIYENLSDNVIFDTWKLSLKESIFNNEYSIDEVSQEVEDFKTKKIKDMNDASLNKNDSDKARNIWIQSISDVNDINAAIAGGANTLGDLKLALKHNLSIIEEIDELIKNAEEKMVNHETPEAVFKKMKKYVQMVIKGINPSVILCGAPGVGKTYNVKKELEKAGYDEGKNLSTIKGKCSPRVLYTTLYNFKNKGNVVVIDDADGLVGPGAPEDCINILKAALDSTSDDEGKLISYGISGKLVDENGQSIPKKFYYNGGIIVITNYNAGSLDTALRGRSFIQDIHFTTEDVLHIIKGIMPSMDPLHLSAKSKEKAYDYLVELSKTDTDMEISIRTFGICAKIFETAADDNDFTDDDAKSMIKEQMKLQSQRTARLKGGKY